MSKHGDKTKTAISDSIVRTKGSWELFQKIEGSTKDTIEVTQSEAESIRHALFSTTKMVFDTEEERTEKREELRNTFNAN